MPGTSGFAETECGGNMRAVCHLAVSPHISPLHKLCFFFVIVSFDSRAVFGQYISLSCSLSLCLYLFIYLFIHCPSQMGAVLRIEPVAL